MTYDELNATLVDIWRAAKSISTVHTFLGGPSVKIRSSKSVEVINADQDLRHWWWREGGAVTRIGKVGKLT